MCTQFKTLSQRAHYFKEIPQTYKGTKKNYDITVLYYKTEMKSAVKFEVKNRWLHSKESGCHKKYM